MYTTYFPGWKNAEEEINKMSDEIGGYINLIPDSPNTIITTLIPKERFMMLPDEYTLRFSTIYNIFAGWFFDWMAINDCFNIDNYKYSILNEINNSKMKCDITRAIHFYDSVNKNTIKDVFLACFGIKSLYLIPEAIRDEIHLIRNETESEIDRMTMREDSNSKIDEALERIKERLLIKSNCSPDLSKDEDNSPDNEKDYVSKSASFELLKDSMLSVIKHYSERIKSGEDLTPEHLMDFLEHDIKNFVVKEIHKRGLNS